MKQITLPQPFKDIKIVVVSHRHIGDTLLTEPITRYLIHNGFNLILYLKSEIAEKVAQQFKSKPATKITPGFKSLYFALKQDKPDIILFLDRAFGSVFFSWLARVPYRIGLSTENRGIFLTHPLKINSKNHHYTEHVRLLNFFCDQFLIKNIKIDHVSPLIQDFRPELQAPTLKQKKKISSYILLHLGTTRPSKNIPLNLLKELCGIIKEEKETILFTGDDIETAYSLNGFCKKNMVGQTNFIELCDLISNAKAVISPDTGPMHLAASYGVPTLGIFGSTDPYQTGPIGKKMGKLTQFLYAGVECSPCFQNDCRYKKSDMRHLQCYTKLSIRKSLLEFLDLVNE